MKETCKICGMRGVFHDAFLENMSRYNIKDKIRVLAYKDAYEIYKHIIGPMIKFHWPELLKLMILI
jgi:hypothetical protein